MNRRFGKGKYFGIWFIAVALAYVDASAAAYQFDLLAIDPTKPFSLLPYQSETAGWYILLETFRKIALLITILVFALKFSPGGLYGILIITIAVSAWTLSYYAWLYILIAWPPSLLAFTMLFHFPAYWVSPVFCPLLLALTAVAAATLFAYLAQTRITSHPSITHWGLVIIGGITCVYSFIGESAYYSAGGLAPHFLWQIFWTGYLLAALPTLHFIVLLLRKEKARFR